MAMLSPIQPGSILRERYQVIEPIGQGGMGSVYRAEDLRLEGRYCALKEILVDPKATTEQQEQTREQFYREASILARLDHPNLPKVSDFFNDSDRDFLVMDYVPGVDLRQKIAEAQRLDTPIPENQALDWVAQICDALEYLHGQDTPVLHRDIKPANIKLTPNGHIKLVDFGLVKLMTPDDESTITVVQGRGSALYTPLEQYGADDGHTDARTDIYSLGATLYHLVTGEAPVEAKHRFLQPASLVPPREKNPLISLRTERAIMWAMEMHPDHRPESIQVFRDIIFSTGPLPNWPQSRKKVMQDLSEGNRILALVVAGLLVLSMLFTLFPVTVSPPTP